MKRIQLILFCMLLAAAALAQAQDRRYSEGAVAVVTSVKVLDGQFQNYMNYLDTTFKATMEAQKKAGLITDYAVYSASPRKSDDADLYLVVTYPNMAALDNLDDKTDAIMTSVTKMGVAQREEASGKRTAMRTLLGTEVIRELKLK
jgi:hypothetical protein